MARERETEAARRRRVAEALIVAWRDCDCVGVLPSGVPACLVNRIACALASEARRGAAAERDKHRWCRVCLDGVVPEPLRPVCEQCLLLDDDEQRREARRARMVRRG